MNEVNIAPVLDPVGNQTVDEQVLLAFTATASDVDLPANRLTFSLAGVVPAGAAITAGGDFTWTPTEAQGPGLYTFDVVVSDDGAPNLADSETITVTVNEVNIAPVLDPVGNQAVDEQVLLAFTATASDVDLPANGLTFSLSGVVPGGAAINPATGAFAWTPTEAQGPGLYTFDVVVTDDGAPNLADSETITVTVNEVNVAPVLDPVGNQTVDEQVLLAFTATASDVDLPANGLTFSLSGAVPGGAAITAGGDFTWTPTEAQGPGLYTFDVVVTDDGTPNLADSETITVTVNEVNVAPTLNAIGDQNVDELTLLSFVASATDSDVPANTLTFSLQGVPPAGVSLNPITGLFDWTPTEAQGPGVYPVTIRVTDNGTPNLWDEETFNVTVNEVNIAPVLDPVGNQTVDEQVLLAFTATASDVDLPVNTLAFSLQGSPPAGAAITVGGDFTWTPTEAQGPGVYPITIRVTDNGTPNLFDEETINVTVNEVNIAPVLDPVGNQTVDEQVLLAFTATAIDVDLPANALTFSLAGVVPAGAAITAGGDFTWTPTEAQGPGLYTFDVVVSDDGAPNLADSETITVTVNEVNIAPVLDPVGDQAVDEQVLLAFTATASDVDLPANGLTFSLSGAVPGGAAITAGGDFTWTPTEAQGPGLYTFDVVVSDDGAPNLADSETITVTVNEVNIAPVLDPVGNQAVDEQVLLAFTATASDVDLPANTLTFTLEGAPPAGAAITVGGVFTWTPTEGQGPGVYLITVRVTDNGVPNLFDEETITVTVNEINIAPVLDPVGDQAIDEETLLTFTATAGDVDLPANGLTFTLEGAPPVGAVINPVTGVFTWTPTEGQGPGVYPITVRVTDDGSGLLWDEETITVTVTEVNIAPVLDPVGDQTVDEETLLTFTATGSDVDVPANTLTFTMVGAPPAGALVDPVTGVLTWTPTEGQGPGVYPITVRVTDDGVPNLFDEETITVTVGEVNITPILDPVGDQAIDEQALLTFTATASDVDVPANTLTFTIVGARPAGAVIDPVTGVFTWTPTEAQGPDTYTITIRVTDDGTGLLFDSETITVTVSEVDTTPTLDAVGDHTVDEQTLLSFTATASDADIPDSLTFGLVGAPAGAVIDPATGEFAWTPTEAQGPGAYVFDVVVTDTMALLAAETITITVNEVNTAPVLDDPSDQVHSIGADVALTVTASDVDEPANSLTFTATDLPDGLALNAISGEITGTTTAGGIYPVEITVTDDGIPVLSDSVTLPRGPSTSHRSPRQMLSR